MCSRLCNYFGKKKKKSYRQVRYFCQVWILSEILFLFYYYIIKIKLSKLRHVLNSRTLRSGYYAILNAICVMLLLFGLKTLTQFSFYWISVLSPNKSSTREKSYPFQKKSLRSWNFHKDPLFRLQNSQVFW